MRTYIETLTAGNGRGHQHTQTKKILQYLLQEGEKTIPEIKDFSGLSLPTTTKLINELVEQHILVESGKRESTGGRPPSLFCLDSSLGYIVGIELLISSFRFSIVNLNHELIYEYETDNFDINNRDEAFNFVARIVPDLISKKGIPDNKILGIGIGITGRVDGKKGISYSFLNFETPLAKLLSERWGYPVFIDNDTRLMALGEQNFGFAREKLNVIYVNLSRGLGIGFISNGHLHNGESGFAGEFGHIHFEDNEKLCVCGKKGCLETVVSGYALERQFRELSTSNESNKLKYREIIQLTHTNDNSARALLIEMGERLGQALSMLVQTLNPGLIILGGRFTDVGELLKYPVIKGLSLYGLPQLVADCEIKTSHLGDKTTMLGAYALVMENVFQ
ncbi:ROK family transcriptional regulator [Emticicia sp.]|uniref:ROK family transcriptional regulator n=1 Tax=Emticicia sp. TaxID=1930953 RepID=UPI003750C2F4